jgi:hypothetical protein
MRPVRTAKRMLHMEILRASYPLLMSKTAVVGGGSNPSDEFQGKINLII